MSAQIETGGPTFPQPCTDQGHPANSPFGIAGGGLSIRDYFAAKAMQSLLEVDGTAPNAFRVRAQEAYMMADAMLAERAKVGDE